jgi:hypothetical protein
MLSKQNCLMMYEENKKIHFSSLILGKHLHVGDVKTFFAFNKYQVHPIVAFFLSVKEDFHLSRHSGSWKCFYAKLDTLHFIQKPFTSNY